MSWASIVKTNAPTAPTPLQQEASLPPVATGSRERLKPTEDFVRQLADYVKEDKTPFRYFPLGLVNTGNSCFLNSVLQCLIRCPPFFRMLEFSSKYSFPDSPVLSALTRFFHEYTRDRGVVPPPHRPEEIVQILPSYLAPPKGSSKFEQHDAHEILTWILDRLHEELLQIGRLQSPASTYEEENSTEDDGWFEVGKKNRVQKVRDMKYEQSIISWIFGCTIQSLLKKRNTTSSATREPSFCLSLDLLHSGDTLDDALLAFFNREQVQDIGTAASTTKTLDTLPPILILQLNRFAFNKQLGSVEKVNHMLYFPEELKLRKSFLTSLAKSKYSRTYRLIAVLTHHGQFAGSGHYTTDVDDTTGPEWLQLNDQSVSTIRKEAVLNRPGYLLFYEQCQNE